jgi:hypothetical protein
MGTPLTGYTPSETYKDLLKLSNSNNGIDSTLRFVGCGSGTDSSIKISTTSIDVSGSVYMSGTLITANASEINKIHRTVNDGVVQANKVLVSDINRGISTLGGNINCVSEGGGVSNGTIFHASLGAYGLVLNDLGSTSSVVINPSSGLIHKAKITSTSTPLTFQVPDFMLNDYYAAVSRAFYVKLFVEQDSAGGKDILWPGTGLVNGNVHFPSGQWTSTAEKYPKISGASYSPASGEIDIFDFWSYDYGVNWFGQRIASGIKRYG